MIAVMDRWVKVISALIVGGILGVILTIVEGHALNRLEVKASLEGFIIIISLAASDALLFRFTKRKLHLLDLFAVSQC